MGLKRKLIALFAALSLVAVLDLAIWGLDAFGGAFEMKITTRVERVPVPVPSREPDYEAQQSLEPLAGIRAVEVDGTSGALEVTRSATGEVTAEYAVRAWWHGEPREGTEAWASSLAEQVSVAWRREGERERLVVEGPEAVPPGMQLRVDVRLGVPDGVELAVRHAGDARVEGVAGALRLELIEGEAVVQDVDGSVEGRVTFGELQLEGVTGDVTLELEQVRARIGRVGGDLGLRGGYGEVDVAQVAGNVKADYTAGILRAQGITRAADLAMRMGEMEVVLEGQGGWNVEVRGAMAEIETDLALDRQGTELRSRLAGVVGDGAHELKIDVTQGKLRLVRR